MPPKATDDGGLGSGMTTPRPDPTLLTTQQLLREIAALKELLEARVETPEKLLVLFNETVDRIERHAEGSIKSLQELMFSTFKTVDEKFSGIDKRFQLGEIQTEKAARDVKSAVDAAFAASKEAVSEQNKSNALSNAKSETAVTKQIDQLAEILRTMTKGIDDKIETVKKGIDDKIDDLKERMTRVEGRDEGSTRKVVEHQASGNYAAAIIGVVVGVVGVLVAITIALAKH
jgi:tetrahydromethanopterin S-methyltransferase subunit B